MKHHLLIVSVQVVELAHTELEQVGEPVCSVWELAMAFLRTAAVVKLVVEWEEIV